MTLADFEVIKRLGITLNSCPNTMYYRGGCLQFCIPCQTLHGQSDIRTKESQNG